MQCHANPMHAGVISKGEAIQSTASSSKHNQSSKRTRRLHLCEQNFATCKSKHTTAAFGHGSSNKSIGDEAMNEANKSPPRSTTPELCFMLAPPAPPAPVASSKPPSPFGPAHNQAGRCKLVMAPLTGLQAWIASGTGTGHPCVDLVIIKLQSCCVCRVSGAISACYASQPAFLTCKGRDQLL